MSPSFHKGMQHFNTSKNVTSSNQAHLCSFWLGGDYHKLALLLRQTVFSSNLGSRHDFSITDNHAGLNGSFSTSPEPQNKHTGIKSLFLKFFSVLLFIIFNCLWSKPQLINE
jgi:hypothetical protein